MPTPTPTPTPTLDMIDWNAVPRFSFMLPDGRRVGAMVVDVYDGDTCTLGFMFRGEPTLVNVRMAGIDTPELKARDVAEKVRAVNARAFFLSQAPIGSVVAVEFGKNDKYGRPLVTLYRMGSVTSVNEAMLAAGHAVPYDGGTKKT